MDCVVVVLDGLGGDDNDIWVGGMVWYVMVGKYVGVICRGTKYQYQYQED